MCLLFFFFLSALSCVPIFFPGFIILNFLSCISGRPLPNNMITTIIEIISLFHVSIFVCVFFFLSMFCPSNNDNDNRHHVLKILHEPCRALQTNMIKYIPAGRVGSVIETDR